MTSLQLVGRFAKHGPPLKHSSTDGTNRIIQMEEIPPPSTDKNDAYSLEMVHEEDYRL